MNGLADRDAVFLAEMGITPLWTLRHVAPAAQHAAAVAVEAAGDDERAPVVADVIPAAIPAVQAPQPAPALGAAPVPPAAPAPSGKTSPAPAPRDPLQG